MGGATLKTGYRDEFRRSLSVLIVVNKNGFRRVVYLIPSDLFCLNSVDIQFLRFLVTDFLQLYERKWRFQRILNFFERGCIKS